MRISICFAAATAFSALSSCSMNTPTEAEDTAQVRTVTAAGPVNSDGAAPMRQVVRANPSQRRYGMGMAPPNGGEKYLPVLMVEADSIAEEAGVQRGDRITELNETPVGEMTGETVGNALRGSPLLLEIERDGEIMSIVMSLGETPIQPAPQANTEPELDVNFREAALELADILEARYLFPPVATQYAEMLKSNVRNGVYDDIADVSAYSSLLNSQLAEISVDRHLRVFNPGAGGPAMMRPGNADADFMSVAVPNSGWMEDGVAFIEIGLMPPEDALKAWAAKFMEDHASAEALVLDLRFCRGGTIDMMNGFLPYLYSKPTHIVTMDVREDADAETIANFDETEELIQVDAEAGLLRYEHTISPSKEANKPDMPVYVLTGMTGSACEHLTLALKATNRATIIGATTAGAGHFATVVEFGGGLSVMVPVGRTYDPATGIGWEGTGIAPDIAIDPDLADEEALKLFAQTQH